MNHKTSMQFAAQIEGGGIGILEPYLGHGFNRKQTLLRT